MKKTFVIYFLMSLFLHCPVYGANPSKVPLKPKEIVVSTKRIYIPDYPGSYNPSIFKFNNHYLLTFRYQPNRSFQPWISYIGAILLDESFEAISDPELLDTRFNDPRTSSQSEDARIFSSNEKLYVIYNDNMELEYPAYWERRDMYVAELSFAGGHFQLSEPVKLFYEARYRNNPWQKNWAPFEWNGTLLLSYSLNPHEVIHPNLSTGTCQKCYETSKLVQWPFGSMRGGTPALLVDGEYLAFFHSGIFTATTCSDYRQMWHYYMGAYTFEAEPPFELTKMSSSPIEAPGFYTYSSYEKRIIYPSGFIRDGSNLYVAYGKDDSEIWIATIDLNELKKTMVPIK